MSDSNHREIDFELVKLRRSLKVQVEYVTELEKENVAWEARIAELEAVLDRMRRDGCGNASPIRSGSSEFETCREKGPGEPDEWCWSCQAHAVLNP